MKFYITRLALFFVFSVFISAQDDVTYNCQTLLPLNLQGSELNSPATSPAYLQVSSVTFYATQLITVTVISSYPLRSYILQARSNLASSADDPESLTSPQGTWLNNIYSRRCLSNKDTVLYSSSTSYVTRVNADWIASSDAPREIYFRVTIVAADGEVWANLQSTTLTKINFIPPSPSTFKPILQSTTPVSLPAERSPTPTPSVVDKIKLSIVEERIVGFQQNFLDKEGDDDLGNEGAWSRLKEQQRVQVEMQIRQEEITYYRNRANKEQQRLAMLKFEVADSEDFAQPINGPSNSQTVTVPPGQQSTKGNHVDQHGGGVAQSRFSYMTAALLVAMAAAIIHVL